MIHETRKPGRGAWRSLWTLSAIACLAGSSLAGLVRPHAALASPAVTRTVNFTVQGCSTWTVPSDIVGSSVTITATGAAGGGGLGDGVSASLSGVSGGSSLYVCVDTSAGSGGNSASGVSLGSDFTEPVVVAAAGGGTDSCGNAPSPNGTSVSGCTVDSGAGTQTGAGSSAGDARVSITFSSSGYKALIVYADFTSAPNTLRTDLLGEPGIGTVDFFNGQSSTPSVATLETYDAIVLESNTSGWADTETLGNNLASYIDNGGLVISDLNAAHRSCSDTDPECVLGRWNSGGYSPLNAGGEADTSPALGTYDHTSPLMTGVSTLTTGLVDGDGAAPGAVRVASFNTDGGVRPVVVYKVTSHHIGLAIGIYLGDGGANSVFAWSGDWARIMANAIPWTETPITTAQVCVTGSSPCVSSPDGSNSWFTHGVTVTLSATEDGDAANIAHTYYSTDGGTSWKVYTGPFALADGTYNLQYYSTGSNAITESTETYSSNPIMIDTVAPTVSLSGSSGTTTNTSPSWSFTVSDPDPSSGGVQYRYKLDGPGATSGTYTSWTAYSSQVMVNESNLADGAYTFTAQSEDAAGNIQTATKNIVIDTTPPAVMLSGPSGAINTSSPSWSFTLSDPSPSSGGLLYRYKLDGPGATAGTYTDWTAYSSQVTVPQSSLADGSYTFSVQAQDANGNTSQTATKSIVIDTVAPTNTLTGPSGITTNHNPSWSFSVSDASPSSGSLQYRYKLDGPGAAGTYSSWASYSSQVTVPYSGLGYGSYTFTVQSEDAAGNVTTNTETIETRPLLTISLSLPAGYTTAASSHISLGGSGVGTVSPGHNLALVEPSGTSLSALSADQVLLATAASPTTYFFTGFSPALPDTITVDTLAAAQYTSMEATMAAGYPAQFTGGSSSLKLTIYNRLVTAWHSAENAIFSTGATAGQKRLAVKTFACDASEFTTGTQISAGLNTSLQRYAGQAYTALGGTYTNSVCNG